MDNRTVMLMTKPPLRTVVVGEPVRVDTRTTSSSHLHTIQIVMSNFVGKVIIEASLMPSPTEADWFALDLGGSPFIEFEKATTKSVGVTVPGLFIWMRAKVDRSRIMPLNYHEEAVAFYGNIDRILLR